MNKKRYFFLVIFIFSIKLYSQSNTSIQAYFYSLLCSEYNVLLDIKNSELMPVAQFEAKKKASDFFVNTFWTFEHGAVRLLDYLYPEYLGYFDSYSQYDATADSGNWVDFISSDFRGDFIIVRPEIIEEKERLITELSDELNEFEKKYADKKSDNFAGADSEKNDELSAAMNSFEKKEKSIRDSEYNIAFFSFDKEYFGTQNFTESKVLIRGDDKNMLRIYYDDELRMVKKETWKMATDLKGSSLVTTQIYKYDNSNVPVSSVLSGTEYKYDMLYDRNGNVTESKNYRITEKGTYLESSSRWKFDQENKIKMKESTVYKYKNDNINVILSKETKKEEYEYKVDSKTPDYFYYENDELRLKKIYTNTDDYITSTYFDGGFVVESYYSDYTRIKDVFYLNGKVKRVKNYAE